jgi:hypothetical protein
MDAASTDCHTQWRTQQRRSSNAKTSLVSRLGPIEVCPLSFFLSPIYSIIHLLLHPCHPYIGSFIYLRLHPSAITGIARCNYLTSPSMTTNCPSQSPCLLPAPLILICRFYLLRLISHHRDFNFFALPRVSTAPPASRRDHSTISELGRHLCIVSGYPIE